MRGDFFFMFEKCLTVIFYTISQCSKLRVHPAPCVHILAAGCIDFSTCAPGGCMFFPHNEYFYKLYSNMHM